MLVCLASLLISVSPADSTPVLPIAQLVHTRWTAKDGAPTETGTLAQTTDGYLWLGTMTSLVRFDGVRFVPFAPREGDSLPSGGVRRLLAARDGSLWIVWRTGGVSHLRGGRLTNYGKRDGLTEIFQLAESAHGTLIAGTATGLARFADGQWKDVGREWGYPGTESKAVWFDQQDDLWAETEDRIVYLPAGSRRFLDPGLRLRGQPWLADFAQSKDGAIWMAEIGKSVHTVPRIGDSKPISQVRVGSWALLIDQKGSLWIGTAGDGLRRVIDPARIRGREIAQFGPEAEEFTTKDGLLSDVVNAILEDTEGDIWVATSRGLERFRRGAFTPFSTPGAVRARWVFASRDTSVWTGAANTMELLRLGPHDQETVTWNYFLTTLAQDSAGVIFSVSGDAILQFQGGRTAPRRLPTGDAHHLTDITVDAAGTLWVFDEEMGLLRWADDRLVLAAPFHEPVTKHGFLFSDREGRIWVGQLNQVALYDHGHSRVFGEEEGVPPGLVQAFLQDKAGNVWAAGDGGLSKFEGNRFRTLPARQSILGRTVYGIAEDRSGAWWIGTRGGVLRLPVGELDRAFADSNYAIQYRAFDQLDGLPGMVTGGSWGQMLTRSTDGRIWVATDSGVASVDPGILPGGVAPSVMIEAVRVDGRELLPAETVAVPARSRDLEIDYTAASLAMPERVQFRYQIESEDRGWRDVGTRRRAYYTGLPPGAYRFRVIASNGDGLWNETGAALNFRILPAWHQTLWFRGAVVLLIIGVSAGAASLVHRRRHQRLQQVLTSQHEATLAERARIAQDLHDTLLQGFAGVSMQLKAAERALPDEPDVAAETLIQVQQLTRETLREARERVLDLREPEPGSEDLAGALEAGAKGLIATTGIAFSLAARGERRRLSRELGVAALLIGREAIANAVRHAAPRRIHVVIGFEPTALHLEVRDDGLGFTPEQGERARRRGHLGLTGMRNRAVRAGGTCEIRRGETGGTVVDVRLPLE